MSRTCSLRDLRRVSASPRLSEVAELEVHGHRELSQEWLSCGLSKAKRKGTMTSFPCDFLLKSAQAAHPTPCSNCAGRRPNAWALP